MNTKDLLFEVMYDMFKEGNLPELDMDDFSVMWKSLIDYWDLDILEEEVDCFVEEINCKKSEDKDWFRQVFNKYFI